MERIDDLALPYGLTGSIASMVYGEPRATFDIDVVIQLRLDLHPPDRTHGREHVEEIGRLASEFGVVDVWRQVLAALAGAG